MFNDDPVRVLLSVSIFHVLRFGDHVHVSLVGITVTVSHLVARLIFFPSQSPQRSPDNLAGVLGSVATPLSTKF